VCAFSYHQRIPSSSHRRVDDKRVHTHTKKLKRRKFIIIYEEEEEKQFFNYTTTTEEEEIILYILFLHWGKSKRENSLVRSIFKYLYSKQTHTHTHCR
jgi:hypothetical protein